VIANLTTMTKVDLSSLLGDTLLVHKDGHMIEVPTSTLNGKTVGVYFSAHWYAGLNLHQTTP
jgi:hypothetical protein